MTQTDKGLTFIACEVEASTDNSAWTDLSGHGASIAVSGGDRAVGSQHTFDGDTPIIGPGKRAEEEITCRFVYTEEAAEPFEFLRAAYEAPGGYLYLRYFPMGAGTGHFQFSTGKGIIKSFGYPQGESGDGAILMGQVVVTCAAITKDS